MPDSASAGPVHYRLEGRTAFVRLDDGKVNAFTLDVLRALGEALARAEKEARVLVLLGREGRFSGGFDLSVMRGGGPAVVELVSAGARFATRLVESPLPVVLGCSGHAVAMGAVLLLAGDLRIGVDGPYRIGLNEVAIGMTLPWFAIELARERLCPTHFPRAVALAEIFSPRGAVEAGFLDRVVAPEALDEACLDAARALEALDAKALAATKGRIRGDLARRLHESLAKG